MKMDTHLIYAINEIKNIHRENRSGDELICKGAMTVVTTTKSRRIVNALATITMPVIDR